MASIYKHPPFYKGEKKNGMTTTPCRKSTSCRATITRTKTELKSIRITAVIQSNSQSIKRSMNSIKGQKSVNSPGWTPLRSSKMCSKDSTGLLGSRCSPSTFWSLLMQRGQCRARRTVTPAKNFCRAIELFLQWMLSEKKPRDRQYIYLQPGGDHIFQKTMMTKPLDHLYRFEEML